MKKWIYALFLASFVAVGCPKHVPPTVSTFDQFLRTHEGVTCAEISEYVHDGGEVPTCEDVYREFDAARNIIADQVGVISARLVKMDKFTFKRDTVVLDPIGGTPLVVLKTSDDPRYWVYAQAYVTGKRVQDPPTVIVYAHVRAVRCEALHGIAFYAGIGTWGDMGHNTLDDPLRWNCAEAVAKEYRESHGPLK